MSLELIKKLRDTSGAGIVDCQKALTEANGEFDQALELLRKRGLQIVNKTADRVAKEGAVAFFSSDDKTSGAMVEVGCESDFVARNENFIAYAELVAKAACLNNVSTIEELMNSSIDGKTVLDYQNEIISRIKEKIEVKRFFKSSIENGVVGAYIHFDRKSGCLISIKNVEANENIVNTVRDLGMHAVALRPQYLKVGDIPAETLAKEKEILMAQPDLQSKPADIAEKIVQGRINKFYSENCFVEQLFVKDDSKTIKQVVASLGAGAEIKDYIFYELVSGKEEAC